MGHGKTGDFQRNSQSGHCLLYTSFPTGERLNRAKPVIEYVDGFGDVSQCRSYDDLPENAKRYISTLEQAVGCRIEYVSVGAGRDEYVKID